MLRLVVVSVLGSHKIAYQQEVCQGHGKERRSHTYSIKTISRTGWKLRWRWISIRWSGRNHVGERECVGLKTGELIWCVFQDRSNLALTFLQICLPKEEELGHSFQGRREESRAPPGHHLVSWISESLSMLGTWFLSLHSVLLTRYRVAVLCFTVPYVWRRQGCYEVPFPSLRWTLTRVNQAFGPCPELHLVWGSLSWPGGSVISQLLLYWLWNLVLMSSFPGNWGGTS